MSTVVPSSPSPKVVLCGDSTVGKTTLFNAMTGSPQQETFPTISSGFQNITVDYEGGTLSFNVWDTAGQEAYRSLISVYFRGCELALLVFDLTSRESFEAIDSWIDEIKNNSGNDNFHLIIVGNKSDLVDKIIITEEEAISKANAHSATFISVSAIETTSVAALKRSIGQTWLSYKDKATQKEQEKVSEVIQRKPEQTVELTAETEQEKSGCC